MQGGYGKVYINENEENMVKEMQMIDNDIDGDGNEELYIVDSNIKEACFLSQFKSNAITSIDKIEYEEERRRANARPEEERILKTSLDAPAGFSSRILKFYMDNHGISLNKIHIDILKPNMINIIYQLLSILDKLHYYGFVHGDLKPANITFDINTKKVTLIDWGGVILQPRYTKKNIYGTYIYSAPEAHYLEKKYIGPVNDLWSLGLSILCLYNGKDFTESNMCDWIKKGDTNLDLSKVDDLYVKALLRLMLTINYKKRTLASVLLQSPVFKPYKKYDVTFIDEYQNDFTLPRPRPRGRQSSQKKREESINNLYDWCEQLEKFHCLIMATRIYDLVSKTSKMTSKKSTLIPLCCLNIADILLSECANYTSEYIEIYGEKYSEKNSEEEVTVTDILDCIMDILKYLNFQVYTISFDVYIKNIDYKIVKQLLSDYPHKNNYEYTELYNEKKK